MAQTSAISSRTSSLTPSSAGGRSGNSGWRPASNSPVEGLGGSGFQAVGSQGGGNAALAGDQSFDDNQQQPQRRSAKLSLQPVVSRGATPLMEQRAASFSVNLALGGAPLKAATPFLAEIQAGIESYSEALRWSEGKTDKMGGVLDRIY